MGQLFYDPSDCFLERHALGLTVVTSRHPEATQWMIKRIDSESRQVWLLDPATGDIGGWHSVETLQYPSMAQRATQGTQL